MTRGERSAEHAGRYLERADAYPRRAEGENIVLDEILRDVRRVLEGARRRAASAARRPP